MRISLFGGPGSGKSTLASKIFSSLKEKKYSIELVNEYIKQWVYLDQYPISFDQVYLFSKQLHTEDIILQKIDHLVTDSPLSMSCVYAKENNFPCWKDLLNISKEFEKKYKSINILLNRESIDYQSYGRFENYEEALKRDAQIKTFLLENQISFIEIETYKFDDILNLCIESLT